jgi:hypothetical protein
MHVEENAMTRIVRFTAFVAAVGFVALSLAGATRSSLAGSAATPTAKNCIFVRSHLPCPCPRAEKARAVARAAHVTVKALGNAMGTTAAALTRAERKPAASAKAGN